MGKMTYNNYEEWKKEMKGELDSLVAKNFERLYTSKGDERLKVWGGISYQLYSKYNLINLQETDLNYESKKKMENCLYINLRLYVEKEFPWELSNDRTFRFVKQYGKLPKQLPDEWGNFELEDRLREEEREEASHQRIMNTLKKYRKRISCNSCYQT